jgi:hypothetical protein
VVFLHNNRQYRTMKNSVRAVLALSLSLAAGCSLLHHKTPPKPPEPPPSATIQAVYRTRWFEKRARDLMAADSSKTEAEARQTATAEFAKEYPYITPAKSGPGR